MKPRILFAINSLAGGGAERVFTTLLAASEDWRDRYDIAVALLDEDPPGYSLPRWLPVHRLDCRHQLKPSLIRLSSLVEAYRPDVMLSFLTRANVATAAAMAPRRRPFVISERANTNAQLAAGRHSWARKAVVRLAYPRATRIIAVSNGVADTLSRDYCVPSERIVTINNPVDIDHIAACSREPPAIQVMPEDVVTMGRLMVNKNFPLAFQAFVASGQKGRLILLGEGDERPRLRAIGDALGLGDRLVMPGFVANPYAIIARASFLALPSNTEGFSNTLVEAMALGVPVISTDCPYSPAEILKVTAVPQDGEVVTGAGGLLVPMRDAKAMTNAMRLLDDPATRAALGLAGRHRVKEFSVQRVVERYWEVIESVRGPCD